MIKFNVTNAPQINFSAGARQGPAGGGGGGAGVTDGDKGDIVVSGSGSTWTVKFGVHPFEYYLKNLPALPCEYTYDADGNLATKTITLPDAKTVVFVFSYTDGDLVEVSVFGSLQNGYPDGYATVKAYVYTDDNITGVSYS